MKTFFKETNLVYSGLFLFLCLMLVFSFLSEGTYEGGDSITHFLISKYSFKHPELFVHHWGKPFFTLISSPFAQLGFTGICIFNALCASLSGLIVYHIARRLEIIQAWIAPVFALFTPIYFVVIISGLTEIFFGLVLLLSILLILKEKEIAASILVSFLPFVRSEGWLLLPLFAFVLIYRKKYFTVLFLAAGLIIYSLAGFLHYKDLLWVFNQNPYKGAENIYGSGPLFWFVSKNEFILGTPLVVLLLAGAIAYVVDYRIISTEEKLLILGSFLIYFIAHSVFWWKGLYGSLGLIRVMAAVTPLAAIIGLRGLNFIFIFIKHSAVKNIFLCLICIMLVWMPFKQHKFPRALASEEEVVKNAAEWITKNNLSARTILSLYPYIPLFLKKDPFDSNEHIDMWASNIEFIKKGNVVVWDSHFCPNEGQLPLNKLLENKNLVIRKQFTKKDTTTNWFEVYVFECVQ